MIPIQAPPKKNLERFLWVGSKSHDNLFFAAIVIRNPSGQGLVEGLDKIQGLHILIFENERFTQVSYALFYVPSFDLFCVSVISLPDDAGNFCFFPFFCWNTHLNSFQLWGRIITTFY